MKKNINKMLLEITVSAMILLSLAPVADAARVKDIADVAGVRENALVGYGLVIGLSGTGDKTGTLFTVQSLTSMLTRMGITADSTKVKVKNVAAVMVTAKLPPFAKPGAGIDVTISSMGDATTLQGGTLLLTPLKGPDQVVYAVAQGEVSVGGFVGGGEKDTVQKNHPTVARIAGGGIVERTVPTSFADKESITFMLRDPDFTTAIRLADAINVEIEELEKAEAELVGGKSADQEEPFLEDLAPISPLLFPAQASDSSTVTVAVPAIYKGRIVEFLSRLESLDIETDTEARVVVNERAGTIVIGSKVRISEVAVAHGNLTIQVKTEEQVSQPGALASVGQTTTTEKQETTIKEDPAKILVLRAGPTIGTLVTALNAIGVTPRDLIAILQAIKAAGALEAKLEII